MKLLSLIISSLLLWFQTYPQVEGLTVSNVLRKFKNPIKFGIEKLGAAYSEQDILNGTDITRNQEDVEKEYYDNNNIPNIYYYREIFSRYDLFSKYYNDFNTTEFVNDSLCNFKEYQESESHRSGPKPMKKYKNYVSYQITINKKPVTIASKNSIRTTYFYNDTLGNNTWRQNFPKIIKKLLKLNNTENNINKTEYEIEHGLDFMKKSLYINNNKLFEVPLSKQQNLNEIIIIKRQYRLINKLKKVQSSLGNNHGEILFAALIGSLYVLSCMASF